MSSLDSYRILNSESDWPFFDPTFLVDPQVRQFVRPLTKTASAAFWNNHISSNPRERHPMLLPPEHWMRPTLVGPNWIAEFSAQSEDATIEHGAVSHFLQTCFNLGKCEEVFFIAMRERCYSIPIGVFLRCWPCFLANDDEGSFLFHPHSNRRRLTRRTRQIRAPICWMPNAF